MADRGQRQHDLCGVQPGQLYQRPVLGRQYQYEAGYKNIRVIPYSQYTDELGAAHGVFTLSRAYIESVLYGAIDEQFITLD